MKNILKTMIVSVALVVLTGIASKNTVDSAFGASIEQPELIEDDTAFDVSEETEETFIDESPENETEAVKLKKPVLRAASKSGEKIKITWKRIDGAAEYILFRSTKKDSGFRKIFQTGSEHYYIDEKCAPGKSYYYQLTVFSEGRRERVNSKTIAGRSLDQAGLLQISNLSGSRKLLLHWEQVPGAASYQIERKTASGKYKIIADVKSTKNSFTDTDRNGGKTYTYRVCAKDAYGGKGSYSTPLSQMAIDENQKMIALTYDDGPSAYTPVVLDALEKYGAHATFFVVGNRVSHYGDSIRRVNALGCEIGNHTYAHNNLRNLDLAQVKSVISETNRAVKLQNGSDVHVMRPPGGSYNSAVCDAAGMPVILWSVDTLDWKTRSTAATIQCVKQKACDGAIVLMHDLHQPTAAAADTIIEYLKHAGYQMVTVSELAAYRGGMVAGKVYSQFKK